MLTLRGGGPNYRTERGIKLGLKNRKTSTAGTFPFVFHNPREASKEGFTFIPMASSWQRGSWACLGVEGGLGSCGKSSHRSSGAHAGPQGVRPTGFVLISPPRLLRRQAWPRGAQNPLGPASPFPCSLPPLQSGSHQLPLTSPQPPHWPPASLLMPLTPSAQ